MRTHVLVCVWVKVNGLNLAGHGLSGTASSWKKRKRDRTLSNDMKASKKHGLEKDKSEEGPRVVLRWPICVS